MEKCPICGRIYRDQALAFCIDDGARLIAASSFGNDTAPFHNAPPTSPVTPPKNNKALIFGGAAVAAAILLIGVVFFIALAVKLNSSPKANVNQAANVQTASEKYKPELKMAIGRASDAVDLAFGNYDATQVRGYFSGEALKSMLAQIELLQKSNMYRISKMENQEFEYFKVNDAGTEAEVRMTETRSSVFKKKQTGDCIVQTKNKRTPQVLFLKRGREGWVIDTIVYDPIPNPSPQPCSAE